MYIFGIWEGTAGRMGFNNKGPVGLNSNKQHGLETDT